MGLRVIKLFWFLMLLQIKADKANNCNQVLIANSDQNPRNIVLGIGICICMISKQQTQNIQVTLVFQGDIRSDNRDYIEFWDVGVKKIQRYYKSHFHDAEVYTGVFSNSVFIVAFSDRYMATPEITYQLTNDTPTNPDAEGSKCSGVIENADAQNKTLGYLDRPSKISSCLWMIKPSSGMHIRLAIAQREKNSSFDEYEEVHLREPSADPILIPHIMTLSDVQAKTFNNQVFVYVYNEVRPYKVGLRLTYEFAMITTTEADMRTEGSTTLAAISQGQLGSKMPSFTMFAVGAGFLWMIQRCSSFTLPNQR